MAKSRLHPQFFQTLVPSFNTHLTIPEDFFLKYIEGRLITELKSDSSDKTWKVNMSDRRLTSGWKEFAVANDFQIGDVVVVRYEGDMVIHVSNLGPNYSEIQNLSSPCNNNDGKSLLKKRLHSRTQVGFSSNHGDGDVDDDDEDNIELHKNKKVKKSSSEAQEVSSSSSSDNSSFVAIVTATDLRTDTLYLPQHFTSSNGLTRNCRVIVLTDGGERSWALNLRFNESSDTFYISQGWRNFCEENRQKEGGFFMFKLVRNGEILVLSFCPTDLINDRRKMDCSEARKRESLPTELSSEDEYIAGESSEDECSALESLMELEKNKNCPKPRCSPYASYSPCYKRYVTFTLPLDYVRIERLTLPSLFVKDNGINKAGEIYLLDKNGTKWLTSLLLDKRGTMALGKGWKEFVKGNVLKTSFTLKLIWEDTTPVLSLCGEESASDREQEEFSKAVEKLSLFVDPNNRDKINMSMERDKNYLKGRDSIPSSQKQYVTLTITPYSVKKCKLRLPKKFAMENDINKPGMTTLLGKDGRKQQTKLLLDKRKGSMALGNGWKDFVKEYGLKTGDSFTLELTWQDASPVFSLCPAECNFDRGVGEGCSETNHKKSIPIEPSKDENIKKENSKEESRSMEREKNHLLGKSLLKKPLHSRTKVDFSSNDGDVDDDDDEDNIELHKNKKVKKSSSETRAVFSSSSSDNSCFVALVTATSLRTDILDLPQHFTSSNGLSRKCCGIVLTDGGERSWALDLRFNESSDTFYISQGWRNFCDENGQKDGDFFMFKLVRNGEIPELSFCTTDFIDDRRQMDCSEARKRESFSTELCSNEEYIAGESSEDECSALESLLELEKKKNSLKRRCSPYSSYSPCYKRYVTFTLPPDYVRIKRLSLPSLFVKDNGINKAGEIYILDKNGTKWLTSLLLDKKGTMALGKGWKEFVKANALKTSFMLRLIWEDTTPVLSLCGAESTSDREQEEFSIAMEKPSLFIDPNNRDKINIAEDNKENMSMEREKNHLKGIDSIPSSQKQFVALTITLNSVRNCFLRLSKIFTMENGINKPGMITLLGKDGRKHQTRLLLDKRRGTMGLGNGWKDFVKENGLNTGDSFTLMLIWEDENPVLRLCPAECSINRGTREGCSETNQKNSIPIEPSKDENIKEDNSKEESKLMEREKNHLRGTDSIPSSQKQFVTLRTLNGDGDDEDNLELHKNKKVKKSSSEAVSSSSSSDNSCFVSLVTTTNLRTDTLYLPQHFTSSNGLTRKCRMIVLTDGGERSWALDLRFNESSDTFYISGGWRNFCDENGQKEGGFFMFKLVRNGEIPVLSFCPTDFINDRREMECSETGKRESLPTELSSKEVNIAGKSSEDEGSTLESLMELEKMKNSPKPRCSPYSSYSPCDKRFVTFTLPPDYVRIERLTLPSLFVKDNGINKHREIYLLDKNGTKWLTNLRLNKEGRMALGKGWKDFVKANSLKTSFTVKLIWEDTTPVLSLCGAESANDREQEEFPKDIKIEKEEFSKDIKKQSLFIDPSNIDKINRDEDNKENMSMERERERNHLKGRDSIPSSQKQFVTLTITPSSVYKNRLVLAKQFARDNSMEKPGMIYLLDTNGKKWLTKLQRDKKGTMSLGKEWKEFAEANDFKLGESFMIELVWEDETPMLSLFGTKTSSSKANEKVSVSSEPESRDLTSVIQNRFVTLALTLEDVKACKLILPSQFMKANSINKLGKITLLGEKMEWSAYLLSKDGTVALGNGWEGFCEANGVKLGESFTLEFICEQDTTPVLKFCSLETKIQKCSLGIEKL